MLARRGQRVAPSIEGGQVASLEPQDGGEVGDGELSVTAQPMRKAAVNVQRDIVWLEP